MQAIKKIVRGVKLATTVAGVSAIAYGLNSLKTAIEPAKPRDWQDRVADKLDTIQDDIQQVPEAVWDFVVKAVRLNNRMVNSAMIVLLMVLTGWMIASLSCRYLLKAMRRMRGCVDFRGESMITGSDFVKGEIPDFQIEIYEIGSFTNKFIGYGLRYGRVVVTLQHIIRNNKVLGIKGKLGKMAILDVTIVKSKLVTDLVYIPLKENVWSVLQVPTMKYTAPKTEGIETAIVSCTGRDGKSTGRLRPSDTSMFMKYGGSTINGMSGAAYDAAGKVHGIHVGIVGGMNCGITVHAFGLEVNSINWGESSEDVNIANLAKVPVKHSWSLATVKNILDDSETIDDFAARKRAAGEFLWADGESTVKRSGTGTLYKMLSADGQGKDGTSFDLGVTQSLDDLTVDVMAGKRVGDLFKEIFERINTLEAKVFPKMKTCLQCKAQVNDILLHVKNTHRVIQCAKCKGRFMSQPALEQHHRDKHPVKTDDLEMLPLTQEIEIQGESAVVDDSIQKVRTTFLGVRHPSPKKRPLSSKKPSKSPVAKTNSLSQEESQPNLAAGLSDIKSILSSLVKAMDGLNSAVQQK